VQDVGCEVLGFVPLNVPVERSRTRLRVPKQEVIQSIKVTNMEVIPHVRRTLYMLAKLRVR
jgi:hypothetical protein